MRSGKLLAVGLDEDRIHAPNEKVEMALLLRGAGWRGNGYVRWRHPTNQGFLRALDQLRLRAAAIGELDEEERCALFLRQLDPAWQGSGDG